MTLQAAELVRLKRVTDAVPSPDGDWLAVAAQRLDRDSESKYTSDLYKVRPGQKASLMTRGEYNDTSPAFLHDGSLAFLSNRPPGGGTESDEGHEKRMQIFAFSGAGDARSITDEPLGVSSFAAARDADVIATICPVLEGVDHDEQREVLERRAKEGPTALEYDTTPVRFWDHWLPEEVPHLVVYDHGGRRDLTPDAGKSLHRAEYCISPDGKTIALFASRLGPDRIFDQWFELIDVESGARKIIRDEEMTWWSSGVFSPDSSKIVMNRHERAPGTYGKTQMMVYDIASQAMTEYAAEHDFWLTPQDWSPDGAEVIASASVETHRAVFAVDLDGDIRRITAVESGGTHDKIQAFERDGAAFISGIRSTVVEPWEAFICELEAGARPERVSQLTGWSSDDFSVVSKSVESTDGESVQYFELSCDARPADTNLLWIHGGPVSDWGDIWHWRWNPAVAASQGFKVILPNPRGSVGFGQQFVEEIWGNSWGGQCFEDLMAVADEVDDGKPFVAMGGSFGGYMTNWIGTQTDRFACLITHAGLFDLAAFHGVTDLPAWWAHSFDVHPYEDRKDFDLYSPIAHVSAWKSPTLVIHGDKDYRVPVGEALALFEALQFQGVESRLLIFPDENHWILRPKNIEVWYQRIFDFMHEHNAAGKA